MRSDNIEEIDFRDMDKTDLEFLFEFAGLEADISYADMQYYPHYHAFWFNYPMHKDFIMHLDRRIKRLIDESSTEDIVIIKKLIRALRLLDYEIILDSYTEGEDTFDLAFSQNTLNTWSPKSYKDLLILAFKLRIDVIQENHDFGYHIHHLQNGKRTNVIFTYKKDTPCTKKKTLYIETHAEGKCIVSSISIASSDNVKKSYIQSVRIHW